MGIHTQIVSQVINFFIFRFDHVFEKIVREPQRIFFTAKRLFIWFLDEAPQHLLFKFILNTKIVSIFLVKFANLALN